MIIVTGGAGFIGSNFVLNSLVDRKFNGIVNIDKLTYAGNLTTLNILKNDTRHIFIQGDIGDRDLVSRLLNQFRPSAIINFAAESHVDRSIHGPGEFIDTNIVGTFNLLESARYYYDSLQGLERDNFRFLQVSTDEVYGTLESNAPAFTEKNTDKQDDEVVEEEEEDLSRRRGGGKKKGKSK